MPGLVWTDLPPSTLELLRRGTAIPAHPLALDTERRFDAESQRALTRYYLDAGAGGVAVGVHSTQFAIREHGLYRPVLELAARTASEWTTRPLVMVAGAAGKTAQAVAEAQIARGLGYHAVLLSLAALNGASEDELLAHCRTVADEMPLIGFYLQVAVGGMPLSRSFWERFASLENVVAVKAAPFNRYASLDVAFGVAAAHAENRVTLYTGNDDHIVLDLVQPLRVRTGGREVTLRFRGGLLGHWSVWTSQAVKLFERIRTAVDAGDVDAELLALDAAVTDCNAVLFDVAHQFAGCIPGCHEVLYRQGLLRSIVCLDPNEGLSPGQSAEIDRLYATYPEFTDDAFVSARLDRWRA